MKAKVSQNEIASNSDLKAGVTRRMLQVILTTVFLAAILFLAAGRMDWTWAWVLIGLYLAGILLNAVFLFRYSPETIAERGRSSGQKDWDKKVGGLWAVCYFILLPLVAGLDARFEWSQPAGLPIHVAGAAVFVLGFALFSWAMVSNAYFSTVVRIQAERGHAVCSTGPYRFVRHPGYTGAILQSLGMALLLGSAWALVPAGLAALLMVVRTALEDRTLQEELEGYTAYATQVRYRLLPGLW